MVHYDRQHATFDAAQPTGNSVGQICWRWNSEQYYLVLTDTKLDGSCILRHLGPAAVGGANGVDFNDNVKARFGTGNDLEIYHDGNDSYIKDSAGTGDLYIQTNKLEIVKANALDRMATFTGDGCC